jgi:hypothetical protein
VAVAVAAREEATVTEAILRPDSKAVRAARAGNLAVAVAAAVAGSRTHWVDRWAAQAETAGVGSAMLRLSSLLVFLILTPSVCFAERWILVGPDNVVLTVIENDGYPTTAQVPDGGYILQDFAGSNASSGATYSGGTFSPRPKSTQEVIGEKLDAAIDANLAYLALTLPTAAQSTVQIKALTRQVNGVLRLMRNRLEASE